MRLFFLSSSVAVSRELFSLADGKKEEKETVSEASPKRNDMMNSKIDIVNHYYTHY